MCNHSVRIGSVSVGGAPATRSRVTYGCRICAAGARGCRGATGAEARGISVGQAHSLLLGRTGLRALLSTVLRRSRVMSEGRVIQAAARTNLVEGVVVGRRTEVELIASSETTKRGDRDYQAKR